MQTLYARLYRLYSGLVVLTEIKSSVREVRLHNKNKTLDPGVKHRDDGVRGGKHRDDGVRGGKHRDDGVRGASSGMTE